MKYAFTEVNDLVRFFLVLLSFAMAGGNYYKCARFDTLEGVDYFQRQCDSLGVWYNPNLETTSEGLYGIWYDKGEWDREIALLYGVDEVNNKSELVEDLFM